MTSTSLPRSVHPRPPGPRQPGSDPSDSRPSARRARRLLAAAAVVPLLAALAACSGSASGSAATGDASTLRLGYFANVTHAPAVVGVADGAFQKALGSTKLTTQVFNAGPAAVEALNAGAIDATFIGPNPSINAYVKSKGEAVRVVAGGVSGGAQLVVKPGITSPDQLRGTDLATPQLGGTQDVALRYWLTQNGLKNSVNGGGDVTITPTENAQTLQLFTDGKLDGAWLPEPWASRLVLDAGAKVLVDEKDLWPDGKFPTTVLLVSKPYLDAHPDQVKALLQGEVETVDWIAKNPEKARDLTNTTIGKLTGKTLSDAVIDRAWKNITPTLDPLAGTYSTLQEHGVVAGTTTKADLSDLVDVRLLNEVLKDAGQQPVSAGGLGKE